MKSTDPSKWRKKKNCTGCYALNIQRYGVRCDLGYGMTSRIVDFIRYDVSPTEKCPKPKDAIEFMKVPRGKGNTGFFRGSRKNLE